MPSDLGAGRPGEPPFGARVDMPVAMPPGLPPETLARARAWLTEDPDPLTRAELADLLDAGTPRAAAELADRFDGTLRFGTAGLRGELGAGPRRMNRVVVIRAAAGLAGYLTSRGHRDGLVVIGYDARHRSRDFALDTAAVLTGAGLRAALLPSPGPTPLLAFAVRHLGAAAGVMVTASHNPAGDNGYKVYLGDGSQIVPPVDAEIAELIDAVGSLENVPRPGSGWRTLDASLADAYLARAAAVPDAGGPRALSVVYTPLHGVGRDTLLAAFARAGFAEPYTVPEQAEPDPDFPTVAFPNPEEPGALDLAFAHARRLAPDLVIANDPDADRCAVGVPDPAADGGWRMLSGDEVGALLAARLIDRGATGTFATSVVSSSLLARMAESAGLGHAETLTGFKWLGRVAGLRYGYEEALGYCVDPDAVRDKDGVTAALAVADLAAGLRAAGRRLTGLLDDLAVEHGLHATAQVSPRVADLSLIDEAMARLRARPPAALAGLPVTAADDLALGRGGLPPTDAVRYRLAGDLAAGGAVRSARVVIRPSGTEPKLKCYLEAVVPVASAAALPAARATAARVLAAIRRDLSDVLPG